jgi:hypothetical protein
MCAQTLTGSCQSVNTSAPATCSFTVIPGQVIVITGTSYGAYAIGDSLGVIPNQTFQLEQTLADGGGIGHMSGGMAIFNTRSFSGSDNFTVAPTQVSIGASVNVRQYSGLNTSATLPVPLFDSSVGTNGNASGSGNITGGNLTAVSSGDFLVVFGFAIANGQTLSVGSGYTLDLTYNYMEGIIGTYVVAQQEFRAGVSPGSYAANFSVSASGLWAIVGYAIPPSATTPLKLRAKVI